MSFFFLFTVLSDTWGQFRIHVFSNTIGKPIHSQHGLCMGGFFTVIWEHRCHLMFSTNFMRCTCTKLKVYWNFYVVFLIFLLMNETLHFFLKISFTCIVISIYIGLTGKYILSGKKNPMHKCITSLVL